MPIILIAAVAGSKRVIGRKGDMPWHFPADFEHFRSTTRGHTVLMGRVTYDSILRRNGKPLPQRPHIIVTRDQNFADPRVRVVHDLATGLAEGQGDKTLFVLGGAEIYAQSIAVADQLIITHIEKDIEDGDAFFPAIDPEMWCVQEERSVLDQGTRLRFVTYHRIR